MGTMADLIDRDRRARAIEDDAPPATAYEGVILDAPASLNAKVPVAVPGIDDGVYSRGSAPWMPRTGAAQETPEEGDRALVVFDDRGSPWVVAWWPEGVV